MSDERADLMLRMLREIRAKQDEHDRKFDEVITRLGALERDVAGLHVDFAGTEALQRRGIVLRRVIVDAFDRHVLCVIEAGIFYEQDVIIRNPATERIGAVGDDVTRFLPAIAEALHDMSGNGEGGVMCEQLGDVGYLNGEFDLECSVVERAHARKGLADPLDAEEGSAA